MARLGRLIGGLFTRARGAPARERAG